MAALRVVGKAENFISRINLPFFTIRHSQLFIFASQRIGTVRIEVQPFPRTTLPAIKGDNLLSQRWQCEKRESPRNGINHSSALAWSERCVNFLWDEYFLMTRESIMSVFIKITICVRSKQTERERIIYCRLSPLPAQLKILFLGKMFRFHEQGKKKAYPPLRPWINRCFDGNLIMSPFGIYEQNFSDFLGSFINRDRRG